MTGSREDKIWKDINSDLSCHELSEPGREGQGGDDQSYYCRKDQSAAMGDRNQESQQNLVIKQTSIIIPNFQNPN